MDTAVDPFQNIGISPFCLVMIFYVLSNYTVNQNILGSFDLHARWSLLHELSMQQKGRNNSISVFNIAYLMENSWFWPHC